MISRVPYVVCVLGAISLVSACGDDPSADSPDGGPEMMADASPDADAMPVDEDSYSFDSQFDPGTSPVSKSGQVFRHALISELKAHLGGLTTEVDTTPPTAGDVLAGLNFYLEFDSTTSGAVPLTISTTPELLQATYDDISSGKNLLGKLAGNDAATDHKVWNTPGNFIGWDSGNDGDSPTALVRAWFQQLDDLAVARVATPQLDPDGNPVASVFLTAEGHDLQQLIQKFLLGAIGISQGMDDYLDDDVDGKGLLASNLQVDGKPYSSLGHAWDEGFGYFGAAIDYQDYTDDERAAKGGRDDYQGHHDSDDDGKIDLLSEYIFGNAANCGKRDRAADASDPTTFGTDAFEAFRAGRELILSVDGELSTAQLDELRGYRDTARENWEKCIAATVVHYMNEVSGDMEKFETVDYDFASHAKHWSELKGFALGLQFNPGSPLQQGTRFADLQGYIGMAPVLPDAGTTAIDEYKAAMDSARALMKEAYGFSDANIAAW